MDSQGEVFKSISGYSGGGVEPYLKTLKSSLKARNFQ
jgi:hypothetical protein